MENKLTRIFLPVEPLYLTIVVFIVISIFLIMAVIYRHHWNYYGITSENKLFVNGLYWIGSFVLIVILILLALVY